MSTGDPTEMTSVLLTVGEIAELAGVGPSAVSNWKRRRSDFPAETETGLYDRDEVISWLRDNDKKINLEQESLEVVIWRRADALRSVLRIDEIPEVLLQLFTLRAAASGQYERLAPLKTAWPRLRSESAQDLGAVYRSIVTSTGDSDPELARALRLSSSIDRFGPTDWQELIGIVDALDSGTTDWSEVSTAIVVGFVERHGAKGAEHSSGSSLVDLMMTLLEPVEGTVYDPACGASVFLAAAWSRGADTITKLYGQEINEQSWRLGFLHLLLQNARFDLVTGDTLVDDRLWQLRADRIAVQPPFGLRLRSVEQMEHDPRWAWGVPPKASADLLWIQHVAYHLSESGVGVVAVPPGTLDRSNRAEVSIRTGLLRADLIDAVVHLPPGMLAATSIPTALVVLRKSRGDREGSVLFIDARQLGTPERGGLRRFDSAEVAKIRGVFERWREGSFQPEAQFTGTADVDDIVANDGGLNPNRYISYVEGAVEIDGEPIEDRFERLSAEADARLAVLPDVVSSIRRELSRIEVIDE